MKRSLNFQMQTFLPAAAVIALFAAAVIALAALFPAESAPGDMARIFLRSGPMFIVIFMSILGGGIFDSCFQTSLSMGCTRKGFFLGFQVAAVLATAAAVLLASVMQAASLRLLPETALEAPILTNPSLWLLSLNAFFMGALWPVASRKNKVWGGIFVVGSMVLLVGASPLALVIGYNSDTLGDLLWIYPLCWAALAAVLDFILWRVSLRMTVR